MGFAVSIIITAVGFILALAVHPTHPGSVNVNTVGWILVVFGLIAFLADLLLWSSWGPGYMRRTYVGGAPATTRIQRAAATATRVAGARSRKKKSDPGGRATSWHVEAGSA